MYNNNHHIYVLTDILIFPINFIKQKEIASYKDYIYNIFFYIDF